MDSDRRGSEEQASAHRQPNVGQPTVAMNEQFMAQMGEFMRRVVGVVPPPPMQLVIQKSPIELVRKYGAEDFKGQLTDDSPAAEYWLERTERIMDQIHCTDKEKLECAVSLLQESAYQWWTTVRVE